MKNYLPKILIGLALIGGFVLSANSALAVLAPAPAIKFESGCGSSNTSPAPLFLETNFLPGDSKTCWIKASNLSLDKTEKVAVEARKFDGSFPVSDLARALEIKIKSNGTTLYGPKLLIDFYKDSGDPLAQDDKEVYLSDLVPGETRKYDITISFPADKGNDWQGKTTSFDIVWGFQIGTDNGSDGTIYPDLIDGNNGGGGIGGYFDENGAKVAGESVSQEGGQLSGRGGFVAAAETGPAESPSPVPTVPAVAGESTCLPIWWWFLGYILLLIILGVAQKMEKKVSVGGAVLQIVLLIAALLWWWFEPCGVRFWVWLVLILIVFLVSLRFYLKKSSAEETLA